MERRKYSKEFKLEAVKLVKERGVGLKQVARDSHVGEGILRRWVKEFSADPGQAFPGPGQMKPEQAELERLRRENAKLKAERDLLKKAAAGLRKSRREVWLYGEASRDLAALVDVRDARCFARRVL